MSIPLCAFGNDRHRPPAKGLILGSSNVHEENLDKEKEHLLFTKEERGTLFCHGGTRVRFFHGGESRLTLRDDIDGTGCQNDPRGCFAEYG